MFHALELVLKHLGLRPFAFEKVVDRTRVGIV
jgi:hypothetical protein